MMDIEQANLHLQIALLIRFTTLASLLHLLQNLPFIFVSNVNDKKGQC